MEYLSRLELYGPHASGKTTLAGQLREKGLSLFEIDSDKEHLMPQEHYGLPGCTAATLASHIVSLGHTAFLPTNRPGVVVVELAGTYRAR